MAAAVARESSARLVAYLASMTGDLAAAEVAFGEALLSALTVWAEHAFPIGRSRGC
ncbi:putative RNA polymerase sigma factor [Nakamurella sp. UYEF19]|uniref:hypothetical protein n=1 Tax=Nakamurella sp. UYEF19 TaxID=1756392 RepID=UPI003391E264